MNLLKHFQKNAFLSPFLLGMLAIFSLPEIQRNPIESEYTVINQSLNDEIKDHDIAKKALFFTAWSNEIEALPLIQAVKKRDFFATAYRFDGDLNHPIRAP